MSQNNQDLISLEKKLLEKEEKLEKEKEAIEAEKEKLGDLRKNYQEKLEKVSSLTSDEAKKILLEEVEQDEVKSVAKIIKEREEEAKLTADKKAQEILVDSMRHGATNYIAEYTVSVIKIEDEDVKGRIIGKEGRNIRAF
ncbi:MAG TPA: Rnase Y domain-containing protein, partial [Candidatus Sulfotelmatobacter sp.]|nr:Rnase Y domain-containing protein [Candidatus Sulfotelmatobacter sp.]